MIKKIQIGVLMLILGISSFSQIQFHRYDSIAVFNGADKLELAWCGGFNSAQFSKIDLDLDGTEDLVVFDRGDNKILTFINNGTADSTDYTYAAKYEKKFPQLQSWVLLRDFNCDGKKDIFSYTSGGIQIHKNISNPTDGLKFDLYEDLIISYQGFTTTIDSSKFFNLYVSSVDIPAINDIDGDGDLDVLTFGVLGAYVEYHRNFSMENYGNCDSIDYVLKNTCWGYFSETGSSTNKLNFYDTCYFNVVNPQLRHTGSTILAFDNNQDSVADIMLGDVSFRNIVMAENGGTAPNSNSALVYQDTAFPSYDTAVDLEIFPAPFYEDVDNDGVKDLICSPNTDILSENYKSAYYYKNLGADNNPNFKFVKRDFLQDEAIDLGEKSIVTFFDHNVDGLLDMVVSSYGYFVKQGITYENKISLFENTGGVNSPEFTFVTDDYMNLSTMGLGLSLYPTFADIDNDGDQDMILGNSEGRLHLFTNTSGALAIASFTLTSQNMMDNNSTIIDVGQFSTPQLYDYDGDLDYDLIVGEKNGLVNYYENIGSVSSYNFQFITDSLGRVAIHEPWDMNGAITGFSTPYFFTQAGNTYMISGGQQGEIYLFDNINPSDPLSAFNILDTLINKSEVGYNLTTTLFDLNNDSAMDLFIGLGRGGVAVYYAGPAPTTSLAEIPSNTINFIIYPNPSQDQITIDLAQTIGNINNIKIMFRTIDGRLVKTLPSISSFKTMLSINDLKDGIYLISVENEKESKTKRFIKQ